MKPINFTLVGCLLLLSASAASLSPRITARSAEVGHAPAEPSISEASMEPVKAEATEDKDLDDDDNISFPPQDRFKRPTLEPIAEDPEEEEAAQQDSDLDQGHLSPIEVPQQPSPKEPAPEQPSRGRPSSPPNDPGQQLQLSYGPINLGPLGVGIVDAVRQYAMPQFPSDVHTRFIVYQGGFPFRSTATAAHRRDIDGDDDVADYDDAHLDRRQAQQPVRMIHDIRIVPFKISGVRRCVAMYDTLTDFNTNKCATLKSSAISAAIKATLDYSIGSLKALGKGAYFGIQKELSRKLTKGIEKLPYARL